MVRFILSQVLVFFGSVADFSGSQVRSVSGTRLQARVKTRSIPGLSTADANIPNYYPEKPGHKVIIPTLAPQEPSSLDPLHDLQPVDTAIGDYIQKQFTHKPADVIIPTQEALDLAYGCPVIILPKIVAVTAPDGCSPTNRIGDIKNSTGSTKLSWAEECHAGLGTGGAGMIVSNTATGEAVSHIQTAPTAYANVLNIADCSQNVMYQVHENVFQMVDHKTQKMQQCNSWWGGSAKCEGDSHTFLQYQIVTRSNKVVAVTRYLSIFFNEVTLFNPANGKKLAHLIKNGEWSPKERCLSYEKNWYISFEDEWAPEERWAIASFIAAIALRDDNRSDNGEVTFSVCQKQGVAAMIIFLSLVVAGFVVFSVLWVKFYWRENLIRMFGVMQDKILPKAMYKPSGLRF